jgi:hypothetical protein
MRNAARLTTLPVSHKHRPALVGKSLADYVSKAPEARLRTMARTARAAAARAAAGAELRARRAAQHDLAAPLAARAATPASACGTPTTLSPFDAVSTPNGCTSTPRLPAPRRLCVA